MQISQELPQFSERSALLVVTGAHEAEFYVAHKGVIEKVHSFKVEKPQYSDKEGFSEDQEVKGKVLQDFLLEFRQQGRDIYMKHMPDEVYMYTPDYMVNLVTEALPADAERNIIVTFRGNYYDKHPTELLEMIQKEREEKMI